MDPHRSFDEVDPRVQIELEHLNTATDDINKLEVDLDESRAGFRQLLCESTARIDGLAKRLGACVDRSRPYYAARAKAREALQETQVAAVRFERANSAHSAAREMVFLAEEGLSAEGRTFDHAWQEMLNHATMRVNESEVERTLSEAEHRRTSGGYHQAEQRVQQLQKELKRAIAKSSLRCRRSLMQINSLAYQHQLQLLPYFELKAQFNAALEAQKLRVRGLEQQVAQAKTSYAQALRRLEQISDEIHRTRKAEGAELGARGAGVGADSPLPSTQEEAVAVDDEFLTLPARIGHAASPPHAPKACAEPVSGRPSEYKSPPPVPPRASVEARPMGSLDSAGRPITGQDRANRPIGSQEGAGRPIAELPIVSQDTCQSATMSPRHVARKAMRADPPWLSRPVSRRLEMSPPGSGPTRPDRSSQDRASQDRSEPGWTEISLLESPEQAPPFAKVGDAPRFSLGLADRVPGSPGRKVSSWLASSSEDPDPCTSRRASLDVLLSGPGRVRDLLSHGIMMLSLGQGQEEGQAQAARKAPSPLDSLSHLDTDPSDTDSLASVEMLTDEQISALMLEQDLRDVLDISAPATTATSE